MHQSNCIMRYLADKHGYAIEDPLIAYKADVLCDNFGEFLAKMNFPMLV